MWKAPLRMAGVAAALVAVLASSWITGSMVLRHPWVSGPANDFVGLIAGTCPQALCKSVFSVNVGQEFADGVVYDVWVCLDEECWGVKATFEDGVSRSVSPLSVGRDGGMTVLLGAGPGRSSCEDAGPAIDSVS